MIHHSQNCFAFGAVFITGSGIYAGDDNFGISICTRKYGIPSAFARYLFFNLFSNEDESQLFIMQNVSSMTMGCEARITKNIMFDRNPKPELANLFENRKNITNNIN